MKTGVLEASGNLLGTHSLSKKDLERCPFFAHPCAFPRGGLDEPMAGAVASDGSGGAGHAPFQIHDITACQDCPRASQHAFAQQPC